MASFVNLDALIPREDMSSSGDQVGSRLEKIDIHHLDSHFFVHTLRKPDFQRETCQWTPEKVADLVLAFINGDLIPAVILWQRGPNVFVIDGAHRLSALIAWVENDYGDGKKSLAYMDGHISEEQRKIADRTRTLVNKAAAPYSEFQIAGKNPAKASQFVQSKLGHLGINSVVAQWVPRDDQRAAEDSFFKINQAATALDKTELVILKNRRSPQAVAARAIVRGGDGHKYWSAYPQDKKDRIERLARELHQALYEPPLPSPIKTLDIPVAGKGYSSLPFVFDFVNWANDLPELTGRKAEEEAAVDSDGAQTIKYLERVKDRLDLVTGSHPQSLGLHPAIYFYTRGGEFQPIAFTAVVGFVADLEQAKKLKEFIRIRKAFERFLIAHKDLLTLVVKATGSGRRSLPRMKRLLHFIHEHLVSGLDEAQVLEAMQSDADLALVVAKSKIPPIRDGENPERRLNRATKSASFLSSALAATLPCGLCGGALHRNSITLDHKDQARLGGRTDSSNAQPTHPFCNSTKN